MSGGKRWRLDAARFVVRELDDEAIVLDQKTGDYYTLEGPGALALRLFIGGTGTPGVVREIAARYDASEKTIEKDVGALLREFEKKGILRSEK